MIKFDVLNFVFGVIDIVVFYLLMKKFLFNRIKKVIDARRELIANQFTEAEEKENAAEEFKAQMETKLAETEEEKKKIISTAKSNAKTEYDKIIDRAELDAQKIMEDARRESKREADKSRREVRRELTELAMAAAEKVVGETASAELDSELYDKFLNESSDIQ